MMIPRFLRRDTVQYIAMALLALGIAGIDQWTKILVVQNIPLSGHMDAIPGLFHLTNVQNTGAAWSSFEGMIWLFVLIFALFHFIYLYISKKK